MSVKIQTVEYVGSFPGYGKAKIPPYPQVAVAGRSNVGKSSLINKITSRKSIARVSSTPGKTRMLNFFTINNRYLLVDLPGYGYAKVSRKERIGWRPMVESLLVESGRLRGLVLLVDGRRGMQDEEYELLDYCGHLGLETMLVFTKIDKLKQSERAALKNSYNNCLFFSAVTGEGKKELLNGIYEMVTRDSVEGNQIR
jgi:GTP-binding protein